MILLEFRTGGQSEIDHIAASVTPGPIDTSADHLYAAVPSTNVDPAVSLEKNFTGELTSIFRIGIGIGIGIGIVHCTSRKLSGT